MTEPLPSTSKGGTGGKASEKQGGSDTRKKKTEIDEEARKARIRERVAKCRAKKSQVKKDEDREKDRERKKTEEAGPRADQLYPDDHQQPTIGRKILAASFSGSKRWYDQKFQDSMAICRKFRKPDFFITFTCNPNWPEIKNELLPGQTPQDRPDLITRVFKLKKETVAVEPSPETDVRWRLRVE